MVRVDYQILCLWREKLGKVVDRWMLSVEKTANELNKYIAVTFEDIDIKNIDGKFCLNVELKDISSKGKYIHAHFSLSSLPND